jgi:hypothetical protein
MTDYEKHIGFKRLNIRQADSSAMIQIYFPLYFLHWLSRIELVTTFGVKKALCTFISNMLFVATAFSLLVGTLPPSFRLGQIQVSGYKSDLH